jgi:hypothetical protein
MAQEIALHRGGSDAFPSPQTTPVDAVQVLLVDHLLEAFTGPLPGLYARQALAKAATAIQTPALAHFQIQDAAPRS